MKKSGSRPGCSSLQGERTRLMSQGLVVVDDLWQKSSRITRGMAVISCSGEYLGRVAAVLLHCEEERILYLLLGHLPEEGGYQSLPIAWVDRIRGESVILRVSGGIVRALPNWHPM